MYSTLTAVDHNSSFPIPSTTRSTRLARGIERPESKLGQLRRATWRRKTTILPCPASRAKRTVVSLNCKAIPLSAVSVADTARTSSGDVSQIWPRSSALWYICTPSRLFQATLLDRLKELILNVRQYCWNVPFGFTHFFYCTDSMIKGNASARAFETYIFSIGLFWHQLWTKCCRYVI
jgi:hypothetical protein